MLERATRGGEAKGRIGSPKEAALKEGWRGEGRLGWAWGAGWVLQLAGRTQPGAVAGCPVRGQWQPEPPTPGRAPAYNAIWSGLPSSHVP